ncbi:MAG TPA: hypothetical protein VG917_03055 [Patescibacteria group bacterium]|nr:hypothetical protein [Patescibacteria group bacterium]
MNLAAEAISILSHPLVITIPASFSIVFKTSNNIYYSLLWTLISAFFVGIVAAFVIYGMKIGMFSDFDISKRTQRQPFFVFGAIVTVAYLFLVLLLNGPRILFISLGALFLGIMLDSFITRKIKASVHLAVYSAFAMIMVLFYGGLYWLGLLFIPVVAWSRIKLKRHVLQETIVGSVLGISLVILLYIVLKYIYG